MIRIGIASFLLVCLCLPAVYANGSQESALKQSYERYIRYLETTDSEPLQRNLVALSAAAAETRTTDPVALHSVYMLATKAVDELLMSDTSYYWDVDQWISEQRTTHNYDGSNRISSDHTEAYVGLAWENTWQTLYSYDSNSRLDTVVAQMWQSNSWVNSSRTIFSDYDANGLPQQIRAQTWSGSAWINSAHTTNSYLSGQLSTVLTEMWNGSAWEYFSQGTYTYTGGNLTEYLLQSWQGGAWVNLSRTTSTWQNDLEMESINENWIGGAWAYSSKYEFTYDGSNRPVLTVFSVWLSVTWLPYFKDSMIYSGDQVTEQLTTSLLDGSQSRFLYSYTPGGNLAEEIFENWDQFEMEWVGSVRDVHVYSNSGGSDCEGTTGNVNMIGIVDLSDLSLLIAYLTNPPQSKPDLPSLGEANVNGISIIDLSDLALLVAYLTNPIQSKPTLPNCPA